MNLVARSTSVPMDDRSVPMVSRPLNSRARRGTVLDLGDRWLIMTSGVTWPLARWRAWDAERTAGAQARDQLTSECSAALDVPEHTRLVVWAEEIGPRPRLGYHHDHQDGAVGGALRLTL